MPAMYLRSRRIRREDIPAKTKYLGFKDGGLRYCFTYSGRSLGLGINHDLQPIDSIGEKSFYQQLYDLRVRDFDQKSYTIKSYDTSKLNVPAEVRSVEFYRERIASLECNGRKWDDVSKIEIKHYFPGAKVMTFEEFVERTDPDEINWNDFGLFPKDNIGKVFLITRHNEALEYGDGSYFILDPK